MTPEDFVKTGLHLPEFMRDFHDQKDLFKYLDEIKSRKPPIAAEGWIYDQIFTIDYFLWILGKCGWTLQRSRRPIEFYNLQASVAEHREKQVQIFAKLLNERMSHTPPAPAAEREGDERSE